MKSQIFNKINAFFKKRLIESFGIIILLLASFLLISLISYTPSDPNFIYTPENVEIENFGGFYGSVISDFLLQSIGLISFFIVINLFDWGSNIVSMKKIVNIFSKIFFTMLYLIFGTVFINIFHNESFWLIDNGNGGFIGKIIIENVYFLNNLINNQYIIILLGLIAVTFFVLSLNLKIENLLKILFFPYLIIKIFLNFMKRNKKEEIEVTNIKNDLTQEPKIS